LAEEKQRKARFKSMSSLVKNMKAVLPGLMLILLLSLAWSALPELYEGAVEDENVLVEDEEPVQYPVEWIYLIVVVALILAAVTYYLYTTPSEVEVKEMKEHAKKIKQAAKKKPAKKPKKKKKK
jgi:predicted negative regulator of RcsB-dependent stress response